MSETYLISDTHFGHANSLTFKRADGEPLRPFSSVEEMDETLVSNWNSVVKPTDKVIHLGDVVINKKFLSIMERLNGKKKLIMGNHDEQNASVYLKYFYDVKAYRIFDTCVMSHIPVHPAQLERFSANVHGHLHSNFVLKPDGTRDYHFYNVSCDCDTMNFFPKPWYLIKEELKSRGVSLVAKRSGRIIM
jgi:calcineurin-like phosphoesterase family protein